MLKRLILLLGLCLLSFSASVLAQQKPSPTALLTEIYNAEKTPKAAFTDQFLKQVSIEQLTSILASIRSKHGKALRAEGGGNAYQIITDGYRIPVTMVLNDQQRIVGLLLKPAIPKNNSPDELLASLKQLPGVTALILSKNGQVVLGHNTDKALAVGSAFKLAVLVALQDRIRQGKASWSDVIKLQAKHISLPSGILQDMPPGAPLTLHTLAALMIARSDNTATDALMDYLGRETIEAVAGIQPMLTTREMFQLKADHTLYDTYAKSDVAGRRELLKQIASANLPDVGKVAAPLRKLDEWYIPLTKICRWLNRVRSLDLMRINPGLATKSDWKSVAYKGGSNTGVLNFSTMLSDVESNEYCLATTWNTQASIDQTTLSGIYTGLIDLIRRKQIK